MSYKDFSKTQDSLAKGAAGDTSKDLPAAAPKPAKTDEPAAAAKPAPTAAS